MTITDLRFAVAQTHDVSATALIERAGRLDLDAVEINWNQVDASSRSALTRARGGGVQIATLDLGVQIDPRSLRSRLPEILECCRALGIRRLVVGAGSGSAEDAQQTFVAGLRWLATAIDQDGCRLAIRAARLDEFQDPLIADSVDLRQMLAQVNRGNVSAQVDLVALARSAVDPARSLSDLAGVIGHVTVASGPVDENHIRQVSALLDDLIVYGYGDVVAVEAADMAACGALVSRFAAGATIDEQRLERIRTYLAEHGLDAIVLGASENIVAASGYWPMNGTVLAVVSRAGEPHLLVPAGEETWAARSGWHNIHVFRDGPSDPPFDQTIRRLFRSLGRELSLSGGRIGVEGSLRAQVPPYMAHEVFGRHASLRPVISDVFQSDTVVVGEAWRRCSAAKTSIELRKLRRAARIADLALEAFGDGPAPGVRDVDLATAIESRVQRLGVGLDGVSRTRAYAYVMSGPQTGRANVDYEFSSSRVQQDGDLVLLELAVVADGYWQDLSRTHVIGEPTQQMQEMYELTGDAFEAARRSAVPGALGHDVDAAARAVIEAAGQGDAYTDQTGHGVGVAFHEQYPLLKPGSEHVLDAGDVIAIEPGLYYAGVGGLRNEDDLLVGAADGASALQSVAHALSARVPVGGERRA